MKKTLLSAFALLLTFSVVGCQPTATDTVEDPVLVTPDTAADSNVTATAEVPATEVPATEAPATEAPATEAPAEEAPAEEAPAE